MFILSVVDICFSSLCVFFEVNLTNAGDTALLYRLELLVHSVIVRGSFQFQHFSMEIISVGLISLLKNFQVQNAEERKQSIV